MQEDGIEITVKLFQFVGSQRGGVCHLFDFVDHTGPDFPVDIFSVFVQFTDIAGTDVEDVTDIFFLYIVGFRQLGVRVE